MKFRNKFMQQGDIVLVPFPFTNMAANKVRPALVVSNKKFHRQKNVMLVAISSQRGVAEYSIPLCMKDLETGKLRKESFFRLQNILVLEQRLLIKKVAAVRPTILRKVTDCIVSFIQN